MKNSFPRKYQNIQQLNKNLQVTSEHVWVKRGEKRAIQLFQEMAQRVPAYKDFLASHHFSPSTVKQIADFHKIPPLNKDNYLRKYPKHMLCWDGSFGKGNWVVSTTSGSTGQPYYFPRQQEQDLQYAAMAELYLRNNFRIDKKRTLYIVAFPMGAWIGGLFTYQAIKIIAERGGYDLSVITPGIHKQEVINSVKQLASSFDQIIIGAYAPFLKDILDDGIAQGVDWASLDVGFVFSAEAFTEKFRDYIIRTTSPDEPLRSTLNHYGTVDMGTMAHETPESILIRRELVEKGSLDILFPESRRQPTFAQYNPEMFYFEEEAHNLLCSSYAGIPLVRYDLKDYGGIIRRSVAHDALRLSGLDMDELCGVAGIRDFRWQLPYVYVYERNDFSVSYYAFLVYPDVIRRALQVDYLADLITGKFAMNVDYDATGRQRLNIHIELKSGVDPLTPALKLVSDHLHLVLLEESSEYRETAKVVGDVVKPRIEYWQYEHPEYFRAGTKQKWVLK